MIAVMPYNVADTMASAHINVVVPFETNRASFVPALLH